MSYKRLIAYSFATAAAWEVVFILMAGLMMSFNPDYLMIILFLTHFVPFLLIMGFEGLIPDFPAVGGEVLIMVSAVIINILFLAFVSFVRLTLKHGPRVEGPADEKKPA